MDTEFKIKFNGEKHQIDANTLVSNLVHITSIIQELNRNLDSGKNIEVKIKALEKGSFQVHIDLIENTINTLKNLLTQENVKTAGVILGALVSLIKIKQFLGGSEPSKKEESKDKVTIENEKGDTLQVDNLTINIYENNTIIREALSKSFDNLDSDNSITGYELTDKKGKSLVNIDRKDFAKMSLASEKLLDNEKIQSINAKLVIIRLSFDETLKSDFYYKGNKISGKVYDFDFYKKIDKGLRIGKGDILEVELEVKQVLEKSVNAYINKGYKIVRVINHIERNEQIKFNFDED